MLASDIPERFPIPWANDADPSYIRQVPVAPPVEVGAACLELGFPPVNFEPVSTGGVPPFGQDINGVLNQISGWSRWVAAGAPTSYNSTFSTAVGGYPEGAYLASSVRLGTWWLSLVDDNTTDPDAGGANWLQITAQTADRSLYFGCF